MDKTVNGKNTDIRKLAEEFLGRLTARKYSAKSVQSYRYVLKCFNRSMMERGRIAALDVTPQDIADYRLSLVERRFKQNSLYVYLRVIRLFFKYLHEHDHVFVNPAVDMEVLGPDRGLPLVPTEEEVRLLLSLPDTTNALGLRDRAMLEMLYSTAMRREEMVRVNMEHLNFPESTVRVMGKGSQERIVPLGRTAMDWVKRYLVEAREELRNGGDDEPALWLNVQGKRVSGPVLHILIKTYARSCKEIRTHITTHSLRRACATHMLQRGANPLEIQLLLGHADLTHLKHYLRLSIFDLKAAHEKTKVGQ